MLIYADYVYKFSIASKGAYAICFVFYMTLCYISSRAPYENCCREVAPQRFLLRSSEKFGREVAPPRFHFQSKSASHAKVAPPDFFFRTDFPFSRYRRGQWSRHIGPQKESHVFLAYKRQEHVSKTRAKREKHVRNTRVYPGADYTAPAPSSPSLMEIRVLPMPFTPFSQYELYLT